MTDSILERSEVEDGAESPPGGISTAVQLVWLMLFVLVLYELLDPHLGWLVSVP